MSFINEKSRDENKQTLRWKIQQRRLKERNPNLGLLMKFKK